MPIVDDPVAGDENSDSEATSTQVAVPEPIQTTQIAASSRLMIVRSASAVEGTTGVSNRRARGVAVLRIQIAYSLLSLSSIELKWLFLCLRLFKGAFLSFCLRLIC
jgi:hypothetical protein